MFGRNLGLFFAFGCCVTLLRCPANADEGDNAKITRIVNGSVTHISEAPYIVQLRSKSGAPFCGGTLISPRFVVTAAHCFGSVPYTSVVVVGGANTNSDPGEQRSITAFSKPKQYSKETMDADVAVLKLDRPMVGNYISGVPLCSTSMPPGSLIKISGWGHTSFGGSGSINLRSITIRTIDQPQCQSKYRLRITNNMFCAFSADQDACQGDSGGPVIYNGELCGIVSWGSECAAGVPGVYSNVYSLRQYIEEAIKTL